MISLPDRTETVRLIREAIISGAGKSKACKEVGINLRTFNRWTSGNGTKKDLRPNAKRPAPANKLNDEEKAKILEICNSRSFRSLPPTQIVPALADRGIYLASESTFYRVLKEAGQNHHRGRSSKPRKRIPQTHCAQRPCQVWTWDITWLPGPIKGIFYYLYMIVDIYSRKIVGWEVHERENSELASDVVTKAVVSEGCINRPLILHSDNGSPMKGATFLETLRKLGIDVSYSRPRVSNDNPYSESLFKTCKYRPGYPGKGFESLSTAREWCLSFVRWYNHEHRHSKIGFVTPCQRHNGDDKAILENRTKVFEQAKNKHPQRWSGSIRKWEKQGEVWLNPVNDANLKEVKLVEKAA